MYRFYKIIVNEDGTETPSVYTYDDVIIAEGNYEFQKGLALESGTTAFLMLIDDIGRVHNDYIIMLGTGTIKPRLFEVKVTDKEAAKSYLHDDNNGVLADYYKRLGGAKQNEAVKAIMLRGIGANGEQLEYAYWVRPTEPEEPTPEPVEPTPEPEPQGE